MKLKIFFFIFKGLPVVRNYLRPKTGPLNKLAKFKYKEFSRITDSVVAIIFLLFSVLFIEYRNFLNQRQLFGDQKQPFIDVFIKRCSENMLQI